MAPPGCIALLFCLLLARVASCALDWDALCSEVAELNLTCVQSSVAAKKLCYAAHILGLRQAGFGPIKAHILHDFQVSLANVHKQTFDHFEADEQLKASLFYQFHQALLKPALPYPQIHQVFSWMLPAIRLLALYTTDDLHAFVQFAERRFIHFQLGRINPLDMKNYPNLGAPAVAAIGPLCAHLLASIAANAKPERFKVQLRFVSEIAKRTHADLNRALLHAIEHRDGAETGNPKSSQNLTAMQELLAHVKDVCAGLAPHAAFSGLRDALADLQQLMADDLAAVEAKMAPPSRKKQKIKR